MKRVLVVFGVVLVLLLVPILVIGVMTFGGRKTLDDVTELPGGALVADLLAGSEASNPQLLTPMADGGLVFSATFSSIGDRACSARRISRPERGCTHPERGMFIGAPASRSSSF